MIPFLAAMWYCLAVYGGQPPTVCWLTKVDCMELRRVRKEHDFPQGACVGMPSKNARGSSVR